MELSNFDLEVCEIANDKSHNCLRIQALTEITKTTYPGFDVDKNLIIVELLDVIKTLNYKLKEIQ